MCENLCNMFIKDLFPIALAITFKIGEMIPNIRIIKNSRSSFSK